MQQIQYTGWVWDSKTFSNEEQSKTISVPWFWLAYFIIWIRKDAWFQGGRVVDTRTGEVTLTWELTGNILSDGRVHIYEISNMRKR